VVRIDAALSRRSSPAMSGMPSELALNGVQALAQDYEH
jgi:hypothetical protein